MGAPETFDSTKESYRIVRNRERPPTPSVINMCPGWGEGNKGVTQALGSGFYDAAATCERLSRPYKNESRLLQDALVGVRALQAECLRTLNTPSAKLKIDDLLGLAAKSLGSAFGISQEEKDARLSTQDQAFRSGRVAQAIWHADQILKHTASAIEEDRTFLGGQSLLSGLRLIRAALREIESCQHPDLTEPKVSVPTLNTP